MPPFLCTLPLKKIYHMVLNFLAASLFYPDLFFQGLWSSSNSWQKKRHRATAFIFPLLEPAQIIPLQLARYIYGPFWKMGRQFWWAITSGLSYFFIVVLNSCCWAAGGRTMLCPKRWAWGWIATFPLQREEQHEEYTCCWPLPTRFSPFHHLIVIVFWFGGVKVFRFLVLFMSVSFIFLFSSAAID